MTAKRFIVRGRVQGVFFRATAADEARRLGIAGRIWNRDDGAVEAVARAVQDAVRRLERAPARRRR
jgi:acylphosphatase